MNRLLRLAFALLIAVALATPSAFANSISTTALRWSSIETSIVKEGRFEGFWSFVTSLWAKNGCEVDPSGLNSVPATGSGCQTDTSGHCLPSPNQAADNGCEVDPSGRCLK
jgi:hypothetical protein